MLIDLILNLRCIVKNEPGLENRARILPRHPVHLIEANRFGGITDASSSDRQGRAMIALQAQP